MVANMNHSCLGIIWGFFQRFYQRELTHLYSCVTKTPAVPHLFRHKTTGVHGKGDMLTHNMIEA